MRLGARTQTPGKAGTGGAGPTSAGRVGGAADDGARRGTQTQRPGRLQRAACVGTNGVPPGHAVRGQAAMRPAAAPRARCGRLPREAVAGCGPGHGSSGPAGRAAVRVLMRSQAPAPPAGATLPVGGARKRRAARAPVEVGAVAPSGTRDQLASARAEAPRLLLRVRCSKRLRTGHAAQPDTPQPGGRAVSVLSPPQVCLAPTQGHRASFAAADCPATSAAKGGETGAPASSPGTPAVREPAAAVESLQPAHIHPDRICELQTPDHASDSPSSAMANRVETPREWTGRSPQAPSAGLKSKLCACVEAALGMHERACCSAPGALAGAPLDMATGALQCSAAAPKQAARTEPVVPAAPAKAVCAASGLAEAVGGGTETGGAATAAGCSLGALPASICGCECFLNHSKDTMIF